MANIQGGNNPRNLVHVDEDGKIQARAVSISEQSSKALAADTYNLNTGDLTLTSDVETAIFYLKNVSEKKPLVVTRFFITFLTSTGGTGATRASVERGVTTGTLLDVANTAPENFNFGSSQPVGVDFKVGASGLTFVGGTKVPRFLFTSDNQRQIVPFDAIILPIGATLTFTFTPPAGNTSIVVQAGANFYIDGDF